MGNIYYPLPEINLENRFKPLFALINKRQSGCFIGLPESAKSGWIKFLFEEKKILSKSIPGFQSRNKVLYFEPIPVITSDPYFWLYQLSAKLEEIDASYKNSLENNPTLIFLGIQTYLRNLAKNNEHITFIISDNGIWENLPSEVGVMIKALWDVSRVPPFNPSSIIFLSHFKAPNYPSIAALNIALSENTIFFPALSLSETSLTIERFENYLNIHLSKKLYKLIYELTGGIYPLVVNTVKACNVSGIKRIDSSFIKSIFETAYIAKELDRLWDYTTIKQKNILLGKIKKTKNLEFLDLLGIVDKDKEIVSNWLKEYIRGRKYRRIFGNNDPKNFLKGKELAVFQLLFTHPNEIILRDEIAKILSGNKNLEFSSEWAIDKVISRIRKKIENNVEGNISTIKNQGYIFVL